MSEIPAPYNAGNNKTDVERIAAFMNGYLGEEALLDIMYPKHLQAGYDELNDKGKKEWFDFTFHEVFRDAGLAAADHLKRELTTPELGIIKRRIVNFLEQAGYEYKKD